MHLQEKLAQIQAEVLFPRCFLQSYLDGFADRAIEGLPQIVHDKKWSQEGIKASQLQDAISRLAEAMRTHDELTTKLGLVLNQVTYCAEREC